MKLEDVQIEILQNGCPHPCLETMQQCRGCFGWSNMLKGGLWSWYLEKIFSQMSVYRPCIKGCSYREI